MWCGAMPRCSGVKQNVTVTSKSASASIWRSNQSSALGRKQSAQESRCADMSRRAASSRRRRRRAGGPRNETTGRGPVAACSSRKRSSAASASRPRATGPCRSAGNRTSLPPRDGASSLPKRAADRRGVPMDARRFSDQQFGRALQTPILNFLGSETSRRRLR